MGGYLFGEKINILKSASVPMNFTIMIFAWQKRSKKYYTQKALKLWTINLISSKVRT
jgi:hypothetical protein